jgi:hypothetical protein
LPAKEDVIPLIEQFKIAYKNYLNGLKSYEDMPLYQALWTLLTRVYDACLFSARLKRAGRTHALQTRDSVLKIRRAKPRVPMSVPVADHRIIVPVL